MAISTIPPLRFASLQTQFPYLPHINNSTTFSSIKNCPYKRPPYYSEKLYYKFKLKSLLSYRFSFDDDEEKDAENCSFEEAVEVFNRREYYTCHDYLESLWNRAEEPKRTLFHALLQCAVGFHHLFNQNHKGAMMELGEGVCKLRKMKFKNESPFHQFEQEISSVLNFIYTTQIELAACSDDICVAMEQTERSYQLLGGYAAGQRLYSLQNENGTMYILFSPQRSYIGNIELPKDQAKAPLLNSESEQVLKSFFVLSRIQQWEYDSLRETLQI